MALPTRLERTWRIRSRSARIGGKSSAGRHTNCNPLSSAIACSSCRASSKTCATDQTCSSSDRRPALIAARSSRSRISRFIRLAAVRIVSACCRIKAPPSSYETRRAISPAAIETVVSGLRRSWETTAKTSCRERMACWASRKSQACPMATAARRANSSARARSCSPKWRPDADEPREMAPITRPSRTKGTTIPDFRPRERKAARWVELRAWARSSAAEMVGNNTEHPVLNTSANWRTLPGIKGGSACIRCMSDCFSGSACRMAKGRIIPSEASRSTMHQSAIVGTARLARWARVAS